MTTAAEKGTPTQGTPQLPRDPMEGLEVVEIADTQAQTLRAPVLDNVYVVYLGNLRNYSEAFVGRIVIEDYESDDVDPKTKEPVRVVVSRLAHSEGTQAYDFSTHNSRGGLIRERLARRGGPDIIGKPFCRVEHAEHVRKFMMRRQNGAPLFKVLTGPESRSALDAYITEKNRRLRIQKVREEETVKADET